VDEMLDLGVQAEPEISAIAAWAQRRQPGTPISIQLPEAMIKVKTTKSLSRC